MTTEIEKIEALSIKQKQDIDLQFLISAGMWHVHDDLAESAEYVNNALDCNADMSASKVLIDRAVKCDEHEFERIGSLELILMAFCSLVSEKCIEAGISEVRLRRAVYPSSCLRKKSLFERKACNKPFSVLSDVIKSSSLFDNALTDGCLEENFTYFASYALNDWALTDAPMFIDFNLTAYEKLRSDSNSSRSRTAYVRDVLDLVACKLSAEVKSELASRTDSMIESMTA